MQIPQLVLSIHITDSNGVLKTQPDILVGKLPVGYQTHLPTIVNEEKAWIILHDANYTHYSLYAKNIAISKKETGNVSFNLLLPFDQKLDEGHRVVDVLDKVKELWKKVVSIRINQKYSLATKSFEEYISSINLCKRELTFPVMKGSTPAAHCICNKGQLGALLNFTRYPLLSTVAWLELGHECPTTINLPVLQKKDKPADNTTFSSHTNKDDIKHQDTQKPETVKTETDQAPVGEEYEIWMNDRFQAKGPLLATTPIQSNGGLNSEDIMYDFVSVTLQELIDAEGNKLTFGRSTAELNLKTRRITLTIPPIKVYYKLEFVFKGDEEGIKKLKQNLETGVNSLLIDGTDVSKEISNPDVQIAPSKTKGRVQYTGILQGFKITARIDRDIVDKKAVLTLTIMKKEDQVPLKYNYTPKQYNYTPKQIKPGLFSFKGRYKRGSFFAITLISHIILFLILFISIAYWWNYNEEYYRLNSEEPLSSDPHQVIPMLSAFITLILFYIVQLYAWTKRLHDLGRTGWWTLLLYSSVHILVFLWFIGVLFYKVSEIVNIISLVLISIAQFIHYIGYAYVLFFKGQQHDNQFGPNPYKL